MSAEVVLKKLYFHKAGSALIINAPAEYISLIGNIDYDTAAAFRAVGLDAVSSIVIDDTWTALRARPLNKP